MSNSLNHLYELRKEDTVDLSVQVGYSQQGDSSIYLDGQKVQEYDAVEFTFAIPDTGEELHRKELVCVTVVKDINEQVNKTSIEYKLTGGIKPYKKKLEETVDKDGGVLVYNAIFEFYTYGMWED